ncbi:ROK family protein [Aquibacillus koreensis]|uniref:ROK family protein n=1 Tax=Aquibacillus koreensis TaxID=279446 RepID=A0A9X4AJ04_9BACI|nr:ROK family protein [Aquibacillus koreensis]MCT2537067.1 ROK family protein [Aquibacillus koreensis]MDC3419950.1 ROK family protein [Aquibacillus koreensis]
MNKYIAFDVGGTKVKHSIIYEDGTILEKSHYSTAVTDLNRFLFDMVATIETYKSAHHVCGVAVSMAGPINPKTGYLESDSAGNVACLRRKSLKLLLEDRINLPIEVENDGNCAALAEKLNGNATECNHFICVTIGTGIGGGIYVDGKILHGNAFRGGEFGFMVTQKAAIEKEIWHHNGATSILVNDYKKLKGLGKDGIVEGQTIFDEAKDNEEVNQLLENWIGYVSVGIYNLAVTLDPEKILIGGGVSNQGELVGSIKRKLEGLAYWQDFSVPIDICKHKNDSGMIGALYHFLTRHGSGICSCGCF